MLLSVLVGSAFQVTLKQGLSFSCGFMKDLQSKPLSAQTQSPPPCFLFNLGPDWAQTLKKAVLMADSPIVMREQEYHQIKAVLARLRLDASARVVFLVDKDGQQIATHGDVAGLDTTSLASLAAGNVAATGGMAELIGEKEFPTLSHEGEHESIHISVVGRLLLVVVFDEHSSLGLVKLRSKQVSQQLASIFAEVARSSEDGQTNEDLPFGEITDEDIESLFS